MEIRFKDYELNKEIINFTLKEGQITGITGNTKETIEDIIYLKNNYKGKITIDRKNITSTEINNHKKKISIVKENMLNNYFQGKVYETMYYEIKRKSLSLKNPRKKILDSLKIVNLDFTYLNRDLNTLSQSEKKLIEIALILLSNPEVIIIEEPFKHFDLKTEKKMIFLYKKMAEKYNKTIVFVSDDTTMLYKYTDNIIITKNNSIIVEGETSKVFQRVDFLKRNSIEIPQIVEITYLALKKKKVKIDYHKDIRDIIKDIYKHV